jgi:hypothetical protein
MSASKGNRNDDRERASFQVLKIWVQIPSSRLFGTVPKLLFEKRQFISALQQLLISNYT